MEEQTWQLLYFTSLFTLKKAYELEFQKRQGYSDLELICAEFLANDERKQLKKDRQKQKKQIKRRALENDRLLCSCKKCEDQNSNTSSSLSASNYSLSNGNSLEENTETFSEEKKGEINDDCTLLENSDNDEQTADYFITEEEKMEYQANKAAFLIQRLNHRELLKQRFQDLILNSIFTLRPRNFV